MSNTLKAHIDIEQVGTDAVLELFRYIESRRSKALPELQSLGLAKICRTIVNRIVSESLRDLGRQKRCGQTKNSSFDEGFCIGASNLASQVLQSVICNELVIIAERHLHPCEYLIFTLRVEGFSKSEVAEELGITRQHVDRVLRRVGEELRVLPWQVIA